MEGRDHRFYLSLHQVRQEFVIDKTNKILPQSAKSIT